MVGRGGATGGGEVSFEWIISPSEDVIPNLIAMQAKVAVALRALFNTFSAKIEAYARSNAPWNDITGAARQGLRSFVEGTGIQLSIYLVTSVYYGVFLELGTRYMAPRRIVKLALQVHYGELMDAVRALLMAI